MRYRGRNGFIATVNVAGVRGTRREIVNPQSIPPPTTSTRHQVYIKWGAGESPPDHQTDYEVLAVAYPGVSTALTYGRPVIHYISPATTNYYFAPVTQTTARSNGWFLKNASGTELTTSFGWPLLDPGNADARTAFIQGVIARVTQGTAHHGVFHDDTQYVWYGFGGTLGSNTPINTTTGQPYTRTQWIDNTVGWIATVCGALKQFMPYVILNFGGWDPTQSWDGRGNSYFNLATVFQDAYSAVAASGPVLSTGPTHFCNEYWMYNGGGGQRTGVGFSAYQGLIPYCQALGYHMMPLDDKVGTEAAIYSRVAALLDYQENELWTYPRGTAQWNSAWSKDMGNPLNAKYQVGNEWRRDFENGMVTLNSVTGIATIPTA